MKKRIAALLLTALALLLLPGCYSTYENSSSMQELTIFTEENAPEQPTEEALTEEPPTEPEQTPETEPEAETDAETDAPPQTEAPAIPETEAQDEPLPASVEKDGSYTTPEDVAAYIHTFGTLPGNFITKKEAGKLGWESSKGNLWDVAPGKSIGGDRFGNREGLLPKGNYRECDINYEGGFRGAERIIYGDDGSIWYTDDHYKSFTQLY